MALHDYSQLDLDDDGILLDTSKSADFLLDEDGILRDEFSIYGADSGVASDKRSLQYYDTYTGYDDDYRGFDSRSFNISELEASRDDLTFDAFSERDFDLDAYEHELLGTGDSFGVKTLPIERNNNGKSTEGYLSTSFDSDYYQKLKDVGVLFDETTEQIPEYEASQGVEYYNKLAELGVLMDDYDDNVVDEKSIQQNSLDNFENLETLLGARTADFRDVVIEEIPDDYLDDVESRIQQNLDESNVNNNNVVYGSVINPVHDFHDDINADIVTSADFENLSFLSDKDGNITAGVYNDNSMTDTIQQQHHHQYTPRQQQYQYSEHPPHQQQHQQLHPHEQHTQEAKPALVDDDAESIQFDENPHENTHENNGDELFYVATNLRDVAPTHVPLHELIKPSSATSSKTSRKSSRSDSFHKETDPDIDVTSNSIQRSPQPNPAKRRPNSANARPSSSNSRPNSANSKTSKIASKKSGLPKESLQLKERNASVDQLEIHPTKNLGKAQSQESFFVPELEIAQPKTQKRILPKPHTMDNAQSFKLKSKSTTNIAKGLTPVKPTHMSLAEITRFTMDDNEFMSETQSVSSDKSRGELTTKLKNEFQKRKHATELVQQLQTDYDKLLAKYALAELTIDQMRLGAKITLHVDSPTPNSMQYGSVTPSQQANMVNLGSSQHAGVMSPVQSRASPLQSRSSPQNRTSPQQNHASPLPNRTSPLMNRDARCSPVVPANVPGDPSRTTGINTSASPSPNPDPTLQVKFDLAQQADDIFDRLLSLENVVDSGQVEPEQLEQTFDQLRSDHDKLRHDYLQAKEDYGMLRRTGASDPDSGFDPDKQLEGCLFQLGMKFDDMHEKVDKKKQQSSQQQLFPPHRSPSPAIKSLDQPQTILPSHPQSQFQPPPQNHIQQSQNHQNKTTQNHHELSKPRQKSSENRQLPILSQNPPQMTEKLKCLHDQYNLLMDRYTQIKQRAVRSQDTEHETQNLVEKLKEIANEAPSIFQFPADLQTRLDTDSIPQPTLNPSYLQPTQQSSENPQSNEPNSSKADKLRRLNLERLPSKKKFVPSGHDTPVKADPPHKKRPSSHEYSPAISRPEKWDHSNAKKSHSVASLPDSGISERSLSLTTPGRSERSPSLPTIPIDSDIASTGPAIQPGRVASPVIDKSDGPTTEPRSHRPPSPNVSAKNNNFIPPTPNQTPNQNRIPYTSDSDSESYLTDDEIFVESRPRPNSNNVNSTTKASASISAQADMSESDDSDGNFGDSDGRLVGKNRQLIRKDLVDNVDGRGDGFTNGKGDYGARLKENGRQMYSNGGNSGIVLVNERGDVSDVENGKGIGLANGGRTINPKVNPVLVEDNSQSDSETTEKYPQILKSPPKNTRSPYTDHNTSIDSSTHNGNFHKNFGNLPENCKQNIGSSPKTMEFTQTNNGVGSAYVISDTEGVHAESNHGKSPLVRPKSETSVKETRPSDRQIPQSAHSQQLRTLQQEIQRLRAEVKRSNDLKESDVSHDTASAFSDDITKDRATTRNYDITRNGTKYTQPRDLTTEQTQTRNDDVMRSNRPNYTQSNDITNRRQVNVNNPDVSRTVSEASTPGRHMIFPPKRSYKRPESTTTDDLTDPGSIISDSDRLTDRFTNRFTSRFNRPLSASEPRGGFNLLPNSPLPPKTRNLPDLSRYETRKPRIYETETETTDTECRTGSTRNYNTTRVYKSITKPTYKKSKPLKYDSRPIPSVNYIQPAGYVYAPLPTDDLATPQVLYPAGTLYYPVQGESSTHYPPQEPVMHSSPVPKRRSRRDTFTGLSDKDYLPQCDQCLGSGYSSTLSLPHSSSDHGRSRARSQSLPRSRSRDPYYPPDRVPTPERGRSNYMETEMPRPSRSSSVSRLVGQRSTPAPLQDDSDDSLDLNASINAAAKSARQIDRLTRKMMDSVRGEMDKFGGSRSYRGV